MVGDIKPNSPTKCREIMNQRVMSFKFTRLPSMLRIAILLTISEAATARADSDHLLKGSVPFIYGTIKMACRFRGIFP